MKFVSVCLVLFAAGVADGASVVNAERGRTITKVVRLLQEMLEKSKADGDRDRDLYAKYKCYCDDNEDEKRMSIEDLTKSIAILENKIAELQASTGDLSTQCAQLKTDMAANEAARAEATMLRDKEHEAFVAEEEDMVGAIAQMEEALEVLSAVGADQTMATGADHKQFMAGYGGAALLKLKTQVHSALTAASALLTPAQRRSVASFIQAPFTGTYTAQSGEVVGILKGMRDTFKANLAAARDAEKKAQEAYDKFMALKEKAFKEMAASYEEKQSSMGGNDDDLASKREQLAADEQTKADDEAFLAKLLVMCAEKKKEYLNRKMLRANEEAAITEAISILNSDAAFEAFGKTAATSTGATGFLQLKAATNAAPADLRRRVQVLLSAAAGKHRSLRLAKIAVLLEAGNPFEIVLKEIKKVIAIIEEEGKTDKQNLDWCNTERETNDKDLEEKKAQIDELNAAIEELDTTINDPETGLIVQISDTETQLEENHNSQVTQTQDRGEENRNYQQNIADLVAAEDLLGRAIVVLKKFYDRFAESLAQEDPAENAPSTWEDEKDAPGGYAGQGEQGTSVIKMLNFILDETEKEEKEAHETEEGAQKEFEDSMAELKTQEAELRKTLADLQATLAAKQEDLKQNQLDLAETIKSKESIEAYLEKIKGGCDFITENFEDREKFRKIETDALIKAEGLIKGTPAYKAAVVAAKEEGFGECKPKCVGQEEHVECKACLAEVTIPGYCAGHADTPGC